MSEQKSRFENTSCSQCGRDFGPGDHGYSHCDQHPGAARDRLLAAAPDLFAAAKFALTYLEDHLTEDHDDEDYEASVDLALDLLSVAIAKAEGR